MPEMKTEWTIWATASVRIVKCTRVARTQSAPEMAAVTAAATIPASKYASRASTSSKVWRNPPA